MSLPHTNTPLTPRDLYPDRVKYSLQFACPPVSPTRFNRAVASISDQHIDPQANRNFLVDMGTVFGAVRCVMSRARTRGAPITVHVEANALRYLHSLCHDYGEEGAHARNADNWLHPDQVSRDNLLVRNATADLFEAVHNAAWHLAACIVSELPGENECAPLHATILELELAVDLATSHPALLVERIAPRITRMVEEVSDREYVTRPPVYRRLIRHVHMISGDLRGAGYSIKAYDKTNRRVRVEVTLNSDGARAHGLLLALQGRSVLDVLDEVALAVLPDMQRAIFLSEPTAPAISPIQAIATICAATRSLTTAVAAIEAASLTGRLTVGPFKRQFLNHLVADGVLEAGRLGVYYVTSAYRYALRFLARTYGFCSGSTPGGGA